MKRIKKRCRHKCNGYKIKEPAVVATMVMSTQGNCYSAVVIIIALEILDVKILPLFQLYCSSWQGVLDVKILPLVPKCRVQDAM